MPAVTNGLPVAQLRESREYAVRGSGCPNLFLGLCGGSGLGGLFLAFEVSRTTAALGDGFQLLTHNLVCRLIGDGSTSCKRKVAANAEICLSSVRCIFAPSLF